MPDDPNAGMEVPEARRPFYDRFAGVAKLGGVSGELSGPLKVDPETAQSTVAAYLPALEALIKRSGPLEEPIREFLVSGAANVPSGAAALAGLLPEIGLMAAKGLTDVTRANIADIKGDPAAANRAMLDFTDNDLADVMTEELTEYVTMPASMMEPLVTRTVPQAGKWMRDRGMSLDDFREQFRQNPLVILDLLPGVVGTMKGADIAGTKIQETLDPTPERVIPTKA
ncbi:MAG: hypothetical protein GY713_13415, partial [Actinomycetia bacterium]|nr:hypothetical protein [Actinomycetes bacterium]